MTPTQSDLVDDTSDPFACAEILAARAAAPILLDRDAAGRWSQCTSCTDPGFDDLPHHWPGEQEPDLT